MTECTSIHINTGNPVLSDHIKQDIFLWVFFTQVVIKVEQKARAFSATQL